MPLIGLFGGTFNPIHLGHLALAAQVEAALHCHQIRFIPAALPPHKSLPTVSAAHRAAMVNLAIADHPHWVMDDCELLRSGPSYTIDTVAALRAQFPQHALCLMLGQDSYAQLPTWYRWDALLEYVHLVVTHRATMEHSLGLHAAHVGKQVDMSEAAVAFSQQRHGLICYLATTPPAISSTALRAQLCAANQSIQPASAAQANEQAAAQTALTRMLPASVLAYIREHGLYQASCP